MNILQEIFTDYYEKIKYILHPRPSIMENIDKMINCGDPSYGGAMYACACGEMKFVPFTCKSRFCPSCGKKYSEQRSLEMTSKLINTVHRHCVFTIDDKLRHYFLENRDLLNCLFTSVQTVVLSLFKKINKEASYTPGIVCVLHTFGRDLKWNPHIHCLITEGGFGDNHLWRNVHYFNFNYLRKAFQTVLLNELEKKIGPSFKEEKARCYQEHKNGFYVYAYKKPKCEPDKVAKYIGRYLGRPVIALSRIDKYDSENETVTFHYNRHEDEKLVSETIPAMEFVERLIRHIPEKQFKMIRYYGLYARHRDSDNVLKKLLSKAKVKVLSGFTTWRGMFLSYLGYDPLKCPKCGRTMEFVELYHNHKPVNLEEEYEKVKRRIRPRDSPYKY